MPPSCAWNRQKNQDGLFVYFNNVTGQVTWVQPDALAWKFIVHAEREQPMWLNFKRNHLQAEVPGELPDNLVDELMDEGATYWWNANTGEKAWATPKEVSWRKVVDDRGGVFWFNSATLLGWRSGMSQLTLHGSKSTPRKKRQCTTGTSTPVRQRSERQINSPGPLSKSCRELYFTYYYLPRPGAGPPGPPVCHCTRGSNLHR